MPRPKSPKPFDENDEASAPSKTQVKQAMQALQDLGTAMLQLPEDRLKKLEMEDRLREAFQEMRQLKSHGARARQLQFIGKLMRNEDVEPYRRALAEWHAGRARDTRALKVIEQWRERLLTEADGLAAWLAEHPDSDTKVFRSLLQNAQREREQSQATAQRLHRNPTNGTHFRALFTALRTALERTTPTD